MTIINKISKLLYGIQLLIRKPYLINNVINSEEILEQVFKKEFPNSQHELEINIDSIAHSTETKHIIQPFSFLSGSSLATDYLVLKLACKRTHAEDYLEIGTWRGESVSNVSELVKNCFTLNLSDESLKEMKHSEAYIQSHRLFSDNKPNITHLYGDSANFNFESLEKKFDVIFIDGDHHTDSVERDTRRLLPFLKNEKSVLIWHDAKVNPEKIRYEVLLGIYRAMPIETHSKIYLVRHSLCAVYIPEEIPSNRFEMYSKPDTFFEIQLTSRKLKSST